MVRGAFEGNVESLSKENHRWLASQELAKQQRMGMEYICDAYYNGEQWLRPFRNAQRWGVGIDTALLQWDNIPQNVQRYALDMTVANAFSSQRRFDVDPGGESPQDINHARLATAIIRDIFGRHGADTWVREKATEVAILGSEAVKVEINPHALATFVMEPPQLEMFERVMSARLGRELKPVGPVKPHDGLRKKAHYRVGGVCWRHASSSTFVVENAAASLSECKRFSVVYYLPVDNAREVIDDIGGDGDRIKATMVRDIRAIGAAMQSVIFGMATQFDRVNSQDSYRYNEEGNVAAICETWQYAAGQWWCMYFGNADFRDYFGAVGPFPVHPYVMFRCWPRRNLFWPRSHMELALSAQLRHNHARLARHIHLMKSVGDTVLVTMGQDYVPSSGLGTTIGRFGRDPLGGNHIPQYIGGNSVRATELKGLEFETKDEILFLMRLSELGQGHLPDRASEAVFQGLRELDNTSMSGFVNRFDQSLCELGQLSLHFVQHDAKTYDFARLATMSIDGEVSAHVFREADIDSSLQVSITSRLALPSSYEARVEAGGKMVEQGVMTPDMFRDYADGKISKTLKPWLVGQAEREAREENDLFMRGRVMAMRSDRITATEPGAQDAEGERDLIILSRETGKRLLRDDQDHAAHLEVHREKSFDHSLSTEMLELLRAHIQETQDAMAAIQKQEEDHAIELETRKSVAAGTSQVIAANVKHETGASGGDQGTGSPALGGIRSGVTREANAQ